MRGDDGSFAFGSDLYYKIKVGVTCVTVHHSRAPPTFDGIAQRFVYGHSLGERARERRRAMLGKKILALPIADETNYFWRGNLPITRHANSHGVCFTSIWRQCKIPANMKL